MRGRGGSAAGPHQGRATAAAGPHQGRATTAIRLCLARARGNRSRLGSAPTFTIITSSSSPTPRLLTLAVTVTVTVTVAVAVAVTVAVAVAVTVTDPSPPPPTSCRYLNALDTPPSVVSTSYGEDEGSTSEDYATRIQIEFMKVSCRPAAEIKIRMKTDVGQLEPVWDWDCLLSCAAFPVAVTRFLISA